jgi:hypothetical protein
MEKWTVSNANDLALHEYESNSRYVYPFRTFVRKLQEELICVYKACASYHVFTLVMGLTQDCGWGLTRQLVTSSNTGRLRSLFQPTRL